jgi:peptide/nickel transport system permease protein
MTTFVIRRIFQALVVLVVIMLLVFIVIRLLPGDPILIYMTQQDIQTLTLDQLNAVKAEFGLDRPLIVQFGSWFGGVFRGDFGDSLFYHQSVTSLVGQRLQATLTLGIIAFILSHLVGIIFGTVSALRRNSWLDTTVTVLANVGITIPVFWLGILLIYFFGLKLNWLPRFGYTPLTSDWLDFAKHAILPVFCLSIFALASITRQTRSSILEVIHQDYIRTAWAKGLRERAVVVRHVLKNGLIPVMTLMGIGLSHILGGSVLIETVFNIPGMGRLSVEAIQSQDYAVIQAIVLFVAITVVAVNLIVDVAYGWLDPRIRYG